MNTSNDNWRPGYHFTAQRNWINDPNGLVWFDGEYHLFYQYNPFGDQWGHMSWGHAVSADLMHWQELPVAIPEDERASIFSGSVVVDTHNTSGFGTPIGAGTGFLQQQPPLVAIYTGCLRRPEGGQAQELAYSNDRGRTWTKYAHNPVLDLGLKDFRDPKVFWHTPTARWVMVVSVPDAHQLSFYASADLKSWALLSHFSVQAEGQGIWECPDLFEMPVIGETSTVWVLKVDVFEGHPSQGSGARLFFGQFDGVQFTAHAEQAPHWADHGADFYAALTWANLPTANGKPLHIWIGWMNCHRYAKHLPTRPWRGAMSVPRELSVGRSGARYALLQHPVQELQALRLPAVSFKPITATHETIALIERSASRALDIEVQCDPMDARETGLILRSAPGEETRIGYNASKQVVFVDRSRAGYSPPDDPHYTTRRELPWPAPTPTSPLTLRLLVDNCSIEVFINHGQAVITEQILPTGESYSLSVYAQGGKSRWSEMQCWALKL
jgi:fructan beta-fructosidase